MIKIDLITGFLGARKDNLYKKVCFLSDETGKEDRNTGK